jgi:hypothetical protein
MSAHRISAVLAVCAAALVAAAPATYGGQPSLSTAAHLEAHAGADTTAAQRVVHRSGARARRLMTRGTRELARAAAIVRRADAQASVSGEESNDVAAAQVSLSAAAAGQSDTLQAIADEAKGKVDAAARRALAKVGAIKSGVDAAMGEPQGDDGSQGDDAPQGASAQASAGASVDASGDGSTGGIELLGLLSGGGR